MWYEKLIEATDDDNTIQYYTDLYETARIFLEEATSDKLAEVIDGIKLIYNDQALADGVTLSTVHKAKGLEAKRVFILAPYEFGRAKIDDVINAQQERNIEYVALTRSKEYLGILM
jgi:superfamily I DNA/RNA helicase